MAKHHLKSERHHWWPACLSEFWKDPAGFVNWILPNGEVRRSAPKSFGVIGNAHYIKHGNDPIKITPFDSSYEKEFQRADGNFPTVVKWLIGLDREARSSLPRPMRFLHQTAPEDMVAMLAEGLISLAVRSPMNREAAVAVAQHLRGLLPPREREALIGLNISHMHRRVVQNIATRGKFAVIYSPDHEFVFGDGFFHNLMPPGNPVHSPKILVPLTPEISVLFARPLAYSHDPKVVTLVIDQTEAIQLNNAVQVYSKNSLFYRSHRPVLIDDYRMGEHRRYGTRQNIVEDLIISLPGVSATRPFGLFGDLEEYN